MMELRQRAIAANPQQRWDLGVDRRHVAAYVGLALVAGFTLGFLAARYVVTDRTAKKPSPGLGSGAAANAAAKQTDSAELPAPNEYRKVTNILHADTIEVEGAGLVRMLGVETPDRKSPEESYGDQAKAAIEFTKESLLGKEVRLEYDPSMTATGNKDDAGDLMAYVYTQDGTLFNAEMIKQGQAFARVNDPFKMEDDFRGYEREAMEAGRGVWGPKDGISASVEPVAGGGHESGSHAPETKKKLTPLLPSDIDPGTPPLTGSAAGSPGEAIVYVSSADHMYHKAGCEYLDKKNHAMSLSEAKAAGYVACGRCFASTVMKAP
ncbi:MAG TPA: thermonuclease family protein [Blastocatellia bacterium]